MASTVKIKRSEVSGNPAVLGQGELAYSALVDNGSNGGDRLYVGMGTETAGNAVNHVVIGGKVFTDMLDHAKGVLTASSALVVDSNSKLDNLKVDNLDLNGNSITSTDINGDINITPNGTGKTVLGNVYIGSTAVTFNEAAQDAVGEMVTGNTETGITVTYDDAAHKLNFAVANPVLTISGDVDGTATMTNLGNTTINVTLDTVNANVGAFGSTTSIPVVTVNAKGLVTGVTTAAISSSFTVAADTGTPDVFLNGQTLTFAGGEGIDTVVSSATNTITISGEDATSANKGIATFNTANFLVTAGDVTIKDGGVSNTELVNSQVTIGSSTVALGATITSLAGLTEVVVDNINLNGNTLTATNTDGNIILSPNGTGVVDVTDSRIVGVATPVNATDAANKAYVDNAVTGLTFKQAANLLAVSNVALTGSTSTLVIDGHSALDSTDNGLYRILLKGQTIPADNGLYLYTDNATTYALVRTTDADTYNELIGASVYIVEGVTYGQTGWVQTNHYLTSFSGQTWVQFSGSGAYVAGNGLTLTGTTFDVGTGEGISVTANAVGLASTVAGAGLTYTTGVIAVGGTTDRITTTADAIDIASTYVGQTSITTLGTVATGTWNASTISALKGGTGLTSFTTGDTLYSSATNTLSKLAIGTDGKIMQVNASGLPVWADIDGGIY